MNTVEKLKDYVKKGRTTLVSERDYLNIANELKGYLKALDEVYNEYYKDGHNKTVMQIIEELRG